MDKRAAVKVLAKFCGALRKQGVDDPRVFLFGSHANGTPREDSDIDVVVLSESFSGKSHWERVQILSKAIVSSHTLIEATALTPGEWESGDFLISEYARQGMEVAV